MVLLCVSTVSHGSPGFYYGFLVVLLLMYLLFLLTGSRGYFPFLGPQNEEEVRVMHRPADRDDGEEAALRRSRLEILRRKMPPSSQWTATGRGVHLLFIWFILALPKKENRTSNQKYRLNILQNNNSV